MIALFVFFIPYPKDKATGFNEETKRIFYLHRMTNEKAVAEKLLEVEAVKLNPKKPFTWASGWKSPIYCDNRKILSFPHIREFIKSEMSNLIFEKYPDTELLAAVATAGI